MYLRENTAADSSPMPSIVVRDIWVGGGGVYTREELYKNIYCARRRVFTTETKGHSPLGIPINQSMITIPTFGVPLPFFYTNDNTNIPPSDNWNNSLGNMVLEW